MKLLVAGSREALAQNIKYFFETKEWDVDFFDLGENLGELPPCDGIISLPQKVILENALGTKHFEKEFKKTRIEPTLRLKEALIRAKEPPKVWISFSSVASYPKEQAKFYREKDDFGEDCTARLVKAWEEAASLPKECPIRLVLPRLGLLISPTSGLVAKILPFFRFGLGSIMGDGTEAFPWIYQKDLYFFLEYALTQDHLVGVYNTVAPQLITSKDFSQALGRVMRKPIVFKMPRSFFHKRLGDTAEIVFSRSMVFPARLLKSGFEFRYPAIYPTLVDCLNKGSQF